VRHNCIVYKIQENVIKLGCERDLAFTFCAILPEFLSARKRLSGTEREGRRHYWAQWIRATNSKTRVNSDRFESAPLSETRLTANRHRAMNRNTDYVLPTRGNISKQQRGTKETCVEMTFRESNGILINRNLHSLTEKILPTNRTVRVHGAGIRSFRLATHRDVLQRRWCTSFVVSANPLPIVDRRLSCVVTSRYVFA